MWHEEVLWLSAVFSVYQTVRGSQETEVIALDVTAANRFFKYLGLWQEGPRYDSTRACTDQRVSARSEIVESAPAPARL